jgi:hypothetical protein
MGFILNMVQTKAIKIMGRGYFFVLNKKSLKTSYNDRWIFLISFVISTQYSLLEISVYMICL